MAELGQIVDKVRSKNAGPFWITIDLFCGSDSAFTRICNGVSSERVAAVFGTDPDLIKRFEIPALHVVKFSIPRPAIQGSPADRDMHGASWAALLSEIELN